MYTLDQVVKLKATFTDTVTEALVDPTTVALRIRTPAGVVTEYTYALAQITKESQGVYYKLITLDECGRWKYRWISSGTGAGAAEDDMVVNLTDV
jgi:hypothetical protein